MSVECEILEALTEFSEGLKNGSLGQSGLSLVVCGLLPGNVSPGSRYAYENGLVTERDEAGKLLSFVVKLML